MSHELVVRGGTVVTATDTLRADVGVDGGREARPSWKGNRVRDSASGVGGLKAGRLYTSAGARNQTLQVTG